MQLGKFSAQAQPKSDFDRFSQTGTPDSLPSVSVFSNGSLFKLRPSFVWLQFVGMQGVGHTLQAVRDIQTDQLVKLVARFAYWQVVPDLGTGISKKFTKTSAKLRELFCLKSQAKT